MSCGGCSTNHDPTMNVYGFRGCKPHDLLSLFQFDSNSIKPHTDRDSVLVRLHRIVPWELSQVTQLALVNVSQHLTTAFSLVESLYSSLTPFIANCSGTHHWCEWSGCSPSALTDLSLRSGITQHQSISVQATVTLFYVQHCTSVHH